MASINNPENSQLVSHPNAQAAMTLWHSKLRSIINKHVLNVHAVSIIIYVLHACTQYTHIMMLSMHAHAHIHIHMNAREILSRPR